MEGGWIFDQARLSEFFSEDRWLDQALNSPRSRDGFSKKGPSNVRVVVCVRQPGIGFQEEQKDQPQH